MINEEKVMAIIKKKARAVNEPYFLSMKKLVAPMVFNVLVTALVLVIVLGWMFTYKVVSLLSTKGQWLSNNIQNVMLDGMIYSSEFTDLQNRRLTFLNHYQEVTGVDDETLISYCEEKFGGPGYVILDKDGHLYCGSLLVPEPEQKNALIKAMSDQSASFAKTEDHTLFYKPLSSGSVLGIVFSNDNYEDLSTASQNYRHVLSSADEYAETGDGTVLNSFAVMMDRSMNILTDARGSHEMKPHSGLNDLEDTEGLYQITISTESILGSAHMLANITYNGEKYIGVFIYNEEIEKYIIYSARFSGEVSSQFYIFFALLMAFLIGITVLTCFIYYIRQYNRYHGENDSYSPKAVQSKSRIMVIIGTVLIALVAYSAQTLFSLSIYVLDDREELESIKNDYDSNQKRMKQLEEEFTENHVGCAQLISEFFGKEPKIITQDELSFLSEIFDLKGMIVYDPAGSEYLSSGRYLDQSFSTTSSDSTYIYNDLKNGADYVQVKDVAGTTDDSSVCSVAVPILDDRNSVLGFLDIRYSTDALKRSVESVSLNGMLQNSRQESYTQFYVIDPETNKILVSPNSTYDGKDALDVGFKEEALNSDFFGKQSIDNKVYYMTAGKLEDMLVFVCTLRNLIYLNRIPFTVICVVLFLLEMAVMIFVLRKKRSGRPVIYASKEIHEFLLADTNPDYAEVETADGIKQAKTITSRLSLFGTGWLRKTPEQKIIRILRSLISISALLFFFYILMMQIQGNNSSLIIRILNGSWPKGVNIFSLVSCVIVILVGAVIIEFIRWLLTMIARVSDARGETVCRLLRSSFEYISVLTIFYICLSNLGVNPSSLLASAGIMGIVIGMGSRELITDILAGLFIIFEGEFQVGDIVEIGGYVGKVREIGIRTTKISGADKNVKIINNRNVTNVINKTLYNSFAQVNFKVPVSVSAEYLEEIFRKEFADYTEKYPILISNPEFKGINSFTDSSVEYRVTAEVPELERAEMERVLSRDILDILAKYNILKK